MSDVLNRTTGLTYPYGKDYRKSVNEPDFPQVDWIWEPDLSAVVGFNSIYWDITGDVVSLVDQATRDARDAEIAAQALIDERDAAAASPDREGFEGTHIRGLFEVFNKRDNYLVTRILELQAALDAMKASVGAADSIRAAIPSTWLASSTRPRADAIQDYKDDIQAGGAD